MLITMFKSKVHRAKVTEANLHYRGSLTLDADLMDAANMIEYEQIHVLNITTGARFTTYLIKGGRGSGVCCLNGAAARLGEPGDMIIALTYTLVDAKEAENWTPKVVHVDEDNRIVQVEGGNEDTEPWFEEAGPGS